MDEGSISLRVMKPKIITMYLPIFREKLAKLERRGKGRSAEAYQLRETIRRVEKADPEAAKAALTAA